MRRSVRRCHAALATLILLAACGAAPAASPLSSEPSPPVASASASASAPTETAFGSPAASLTAEPVAWSQLGAVGPEAREDHTWTVDPEAGIAYLFGGRDGSTTFGDTWAYDLASDAWTRLEPTSSPDGRFGHEAAWVDGVGLVIFAGQASGDVFFGDLWAYDPAANTWEELTVTGAVPTPRYGSCAGIGPDGRLWISHGFTSDGTRFSDTRAYDFRTATWTDETPSVGSRPVERCLHGCWWTDTDELVLYAGQTTGRLALDDRWRLVGGAWEQIEGGAPTARNLYARARTEGATLIFGGQALDGSYLGDLWSLGDDAGEAAAEIELAGDGSQPAPRAGAELILDDARGRALLFGGRTADGALGDLWVLGGL